MVLVRNNDSESSYESDNDSLDDDKTTFSELHHAQSNDKDNMVELNIKNKENVSHIFRNNYFLTTQSYSESSSSESENEEDELFSPELFGLPDNPGVVRFDCIDYPLAVTEHSDEEYVVEHKTDQAWIKVSCDDLTQENHILCDKWKNCHKKKLSISLDDLKYHVCMRRE